MAGHVGLVVEAGGHGGIGQGRTAAHRRLEPRVFGDRVGHERQRRPAKRVADQVGRTMR